jgi:hypothetical protein
MNLDTINFRSFTAWFNDYYTPDDKESIILHGSEEFLPYDDQMSELFDAFGAEIEDLALREGDVSLSEFCIGLESTQQLINKLCHAAIERQAMLWQDTVDEPDDSPSETDDDDDYETA